MSSNRHWYTHFIVVKLRPDFFIADYFEQDARLSDLERKGRHIMHVSPVDNNIKHIWYTLLWNNQISVCISFYIVVILILTEPRWWGNDIDKYKPNQTINIRNTDWIFRCLELTLQIEYFRYIVSLAPRKLCWNQTHWIVNYVIGLSITPWPEHSMSNGTTAHILALRWFVHNSISPQHTFLVI